MPERERIAINLTVDAELYNKLKQYCEEQGMIISRQFDIMMRMYLEDRGVLKPGP